MARATCGGGDLKRVAKRFSGFEFCPPFFFELRDSYLKLVGIEAITGEIDELGLVKGKVEKCQSRMVKQSWDLGNTVGICHSPLQSKPSRKISLRHSVGRHVSVWLRAPSRLCAVVW